MRVIVSCWTGTINVRFIDHDGVIFFCFYQNSVHLTKIINLGKSCLIGTTSYAEVVPIRHDFCHVILKSCLIGTTSYAEVVPIRHDFCHVILKSCQLGTTSALSYWSHANLARLLPRHTEVVPTWHDFCPVIL